MNEGNLEPSDQILSVYRELVASKYPEAVDFWPLLSGCDVTTGTHKLYWIFIFKHTGTPYLRSQNGVGELPTAITGVGEISESNKSEVRSRLESRYRLTASDAVVFVKNGHLPREELLIMLNRHKKAMGISPSRIFLSHKGADKNKVRNFKTTLELLGFSPWLDEDAMAAGVELERGILKGFKDSCAAVFFVTPNFKDENYLASEVNYAMSEKRKKGERFSIITLVFQENERKGNVPDLLHTYVWKEPGSDLEALREIVKALPIKIGETSWKY